MRGYVDTRWGQLHYSTTGAGSRAIVLFHETPLNHGAWQRTIPFLPAGYQVVAFDTPGYGESDPPPGITTIEEYAATFAEGIRALGLERIVPVGVHTGAQYALQVAAVELPDRTDAAVLLGLPFYEEEVRLARVPAVVPPFRDDGSHLVEGFLRPPKEYDPELRSRMVGAVSELPDRAFWAYHSVYTYSPGDALPLVDAPVLVLTSSIDILHPGDVKALPLLKNGTMVEVSTEHLPLYWMQPEAVAREITSFLTAHGLGPDTEAGA